MGNGVDEHNFVEIRSQNNVYDVYINSEYLTTFFIPDFSSGSCGLIISPATKARVSYYYINIEGKETAVVNYISEENSEMIQNSSIEKLNKRIKTLESNNKTLNDLNTEIKNLHKQEIETLIKKS